MRFDLKVLAVFPTLLLLSGFPVHAQAPATKAERPAAKPQTRDHGKKVAVDPSKIIVDDGDTVSINWSDDDIEIVRILGIDTPETRHVPHNIPFDQPFGREARAFAQGVFALASKVEILRCSTIDPYGRTLAYLFVNDKNYSILVVKAHLAEESVSFYGDNGLPDESKAVLEAALAAGPVPFEPPHLYRTRMRKVMESAKDFPEMIGD